MDWKPATELPEVKATLIVQTNYGYMSGYRDVNGLFTPYDPIAGNVMRMLRHPEKPCYAIRWRYKFPQVVEAVKKMREKI